MKSKIGKFGLAKGSKVASVKFTKECKVRGKLRVPGETMSIEVKRASSLVAKGLCVIVGMDTRDGDGNVSRSSFAGREKSKRVGPKKAPQKPAKPAKKDAPAEDAGSPVEAAQEPVREEDKLAPIGKDSPGVDTSAEGPVMCPVCNAKFDTLRGMKIHMSQTHKITYSAWKKQNDR